MDREKLKKVAIMAIEGTPGERVVARRILKKQGISLGELLDSPKNQEKKQKSSNSSDESFEKNGLSLDEIISNNIDNFCNDFKGSFQKALINFFKK